MSNLIYEELDYCYCDNCRNNSRMYDDNDSPCDYCHRKYSGWGVSKEVANNIEKKIRNEVIDEFMHKLSSLGYFVIPHDLTVIQQVANSVKESDKND